MAKIYLNQVILIFIWRVHKCINSITLLYLFNRFSMFKARLLNKLQWFHSWCIMDILFFDISLTVGTHLLYIVSIRNKKLLLIPSLKRCKVEGFRNLGLPSYFRNHIYYCIFIIKRHFITIIYHIQLYYGLTILRVIAKYIVFNITNESYKNIQRAPLLCHPSFGLEFFKMILCLWHGILFKWILQQYHIIFFH